MGVRGTILYLLFGLGEGILLNFFVNLGTTYSLIATRAIQSLHN